MKTQEIKSGQILIATPGLHDPSFERTVVLICEHSNEGTVGMVLNHVTQNILRDVLDEISCDFPLHIGGPVEQNSLNFVHNLGTKIPGSYAIKPNLFWNGDFETLKEMINLRIIAENEIKFFLGYAGWDKDQLQKEINEGAWVISDIDSQLLFEESLDQFWQKVLRKMGGQYKIMANFPKDPRLN